MLTPKQKELLLLIHGRVQETGVPPSFDEMKDALDLKSKSGIHRLITALEERGFIRRLPHRARALEIIKMPEALTEAAQARRAGGTAASAPLSVRSEAGGQGKAHDGEPRGFAEPSQPSLSPAEIAHLMAQTPATVPMMGRIAAGVPISAIQEHTQDVICPPDMLGPGEHFALEVRGDSMIDAGIHDGDVVIIRRTNSASNGDIIVALVEKEEATLKRLRRKGGTIGLEAANPAYETRYLGPDQVDIQGRLVGLIRRY